MPPDRPATHLDPVLTTSDHLSSIPMSSPDKFSLPIRRNVASHIARPTLSQLHGISFSIGARGALSEVSDGGGSKEQEDDGLTLLSLPGEGSLHPSVQESPKDSSAASVGVDPERMMSLYKEAMAEQRAAAGLPMEDMVVSGLASQFSVMQVPISISLPKGGRRGAPLALDLDR